MRSSLVFTGLVALAAAAPRPQDIDFAGASTVTYSITPGLAEETPTAVPSALVQSVINQVLATPLSTTPSKRDASKVKRAACSPEPTVANTYGLTSLNNPVAFKADRAITTVVNSAPVPTGYLKSFGNQKGAATGYGFLGYYLMSTYDTNACAQNCNKTAGCVSFNMYFERDPVVTPGDGCGNPNATAAIKCTLWSIPLVATAATNTGQSRVNFTVVVAGSNGYNSLAAPSAPSGYNGTFLGSAAIDAPTTGCTQKGSYMGHYLFTDNVFDFNKCAAACTTTSQSSLVSCNFFNTYVLYKNNTAWAQYCTLYTKTWGASLATKTNQTFNYDTYTVGYSWSFSNTTNIGTTC